MYQQFQKQGGNQNGQKRNYFITFVMMFLIAFFQPVAAQQRKATDKNIGDAIASIKEAYYCSDADYHTDGQRTVWVKSYKSWIPADFNTLKKEAPHVLKFLYQAINHNRLDVLEQLLPDYYRNRGGVKQFAQDISKIY